MVFLSMTEGLDLGILTGGGGVLWTIIERSSTIWRAEDFNVLEMHQISYTAGYSEVISSGITPDIRNDLRFKNRGVCHILLEIINCVYLQDKSLTLEPHEFKMCLISLGYNLKEGEKVSAGSSAQLLVFLPCFSLLETTAVRVTGGGGEICQNRGSKIQVNSVSTITPVFH